MCAVVEINGEVCTTQGDLMDALGTADLVPDLAQGYSDADIKQNLCICPVDIMATAAKHGFRVEPEAHIGGLVEYSLVPNAEITGRQKRSF